MAFDLQARPLALCISVALISIYAFRTIKYHATHKLPPGPKGLPFFGPLFQLSATPWKEFEMWKVQYGPLVYMNLVGQNVLVINSNKVASDLLDRRGNIYSDRPRLIMAGEIFTGGLIIFLVRFGEVWRKMRRASHESLNKGRVSAFHPVQVKEAVLLVDGMLRNPATWEQEIRRATASTVLAIIYDHPTVTSLGNPTVVKANKFVDIGSHYSVPGNYLVEFFPWMRYIPSSMAGWKRLAEERFADYNKMFLDMFYAVEARIKQGDERESFVGSLVRERQRYGMTDPENAWLAAAMYVAGAETTSTTMTWFMLAMITYPEAQRKCQEELDAVVGRSRMPTFADLDSLPYVRATAREALRWRTVVPLGIQHCTIEDDWYEGYFIPKGTMCIPHVWTINRDRAVYGDDADDFKPDRWIGKLSNVLAETHDGHVTYGFGQRICSGRHMANNALFIDIASLLWGTNISAVKDEAGKPIIPDTLETVNSGLVVRPLPFECVITPRFPEARAIISQTRELLE